MGLFVFIPFAQTCLLSLSFSLQSDGGPYIRPCTNSRVADNPPRNADKWSLDERIVLLSSVQIGIHFCLYAKPFSSVCKTERWKTEPAILPELSGVPGSLRGVRCREFLRASQSARIP